MSIDAMAWRPRKAQPKSIASAWEIYCNGARWVGTCETFDKALERIQSGLTWRSDVPGDRTEWTIKIVKL